MTRTPFLLDCDPGIDDAFAVMCAFTYGDVRAITAVSGNVGVDDTTRNARFLVELAGADVPVHRGAEGPLHVEQQLADYIHGERGLGSLEFDEPALPTSAVPATQAILDHCANGDATIVALGPLTNIALAIQADPTVVERISHLYWMGGSTTVGNVTPLAEFNSWVDPHATDITLRCGVPLTMFGLNLTHQVRLGDDAIAQLQRSESPVASLFSGLLRYYYENGRRDPAGQPMHDTCAILGLTHPELFETIESNIVANVSEGKLRGVTELMNDDQSGIHRVAVRADADAAIDLIMAAVDEASHG